jgi:hypothetical protein
MQFLLLLSALLSAVTGAFAGPRPDLARMSQVEATIVEAAPAAPRRADGARPASGWHRTILDRPLAPLAERMPRPAPALRFVRLIE